MNKFAADRDSPRLACLLHGCQLQLADARRPSRQFFPYFCIQDWQQRGGPAHEVRSGRWSMVLLGHI
jgi:hypothetical protein